MKILKVKVLKGYKAYLKNTEYGYHYTFIDKNFDNFFDKEINEYFSAVVIKEAFNFSSFKHGNDSNEPDLLFDNKEWFEISLICDAKKRNNLIQSIKNRNFNIDNVEEELLSMIQRRAEEKSQKEYIYLQPNLCLVCPIPMINWVEDFSDIELIFMSKKQKKFNDIYDKYVKTKIFKDIFIIVPSIDASWVLINLKDKRIRFEGDINNIKYPYYIMQ